MWMLIYKDLCLHRKSLIQFLLIAVILSVIFISNGDSGAAILGTMAAVGVWNFAARAAYDEERNRTYGFLWTLPFRRSRIVISKYMVVLLVWCCYASLFSLVAWLAQILGFVVSAWETILLIITVLLTLLPVMGLYLWAGFQWGFIRATNGMRFAFLLWLLPTILPQSMMKGLSDALHAVITHPLTPYLTLVVVLALYLLFMLAAITAFARKELDTLA